MLISTYVHLLVSAASEPLTEVLPAPCILVLIWTFQCSPRSNRVEFEHTHAPPRVVLRSEGVVRRNSPRGGLPNRISPNQDYLKRSRAASSTVSNALLTLTALATKHWIRTSKLSGLSSPDS